MFGLRAYYFYWNSLFFQSLFFKIWKYDPVSMDFFTKHIRGLNQDYVSMHILQHCLLRSDQSSSVLHFFRDFDWGISY